MASSCVPGVYNGHREILKAGAAAEFRLPINVPSPAHAQFIAREPSDPLEGTRALTATRARQDVPN